MTPEQVALVRSRFAKVVPIKETAADLFYARLFELDPSLRPLFKGDTKAQGLKLMTMIGLGQRLRHSCRHDEGGRRGVGLSRACLRS